MFETKFRKKQIKLAKEKLNEPNWSPTPEQAVARECISKAVFTFNQTQATGKRQTSSNTTNNGSEHQSKSLLNNMISQMSYNDLKKQKIKQTRNEIWTQFMENCVHSMHDPQTHIMNLCKQHKIVL